MAASSGGRDIDRGWAWVVMAATYLGLVMFSTSFFTVGVIYVKLLDHYRDGEVKTSLVGTVNTALYCLLAPFASAAASRFTCRASIITGGMLMAAASLLSSFADSVDKLILTYGVLGGIGNTFVGIPLKVILGYYFEKRRHFVISLGAAVFGAGMFLSTPMALLVFTEYGINGGFMILSGFNLNMCVIGMICKPSSLELKIKQHTVSQKLAISKSIVSMSTLANTCRRYISKLNDLFHFETLTDLTFVLFLFSTFTWNLMLAVCQMHLPNYVLLSGSGPREVTLIMLIFGACNTIGRFVGAVSVTNPRIDSLALHVLLLAISGVLVLTFPLYGYISGSNYLFAITIGLLTGGPNGIMTSIGLRILGLQKLAAAHGLEYFFCGLGFGGGPPVASALYSHSGSYSSSFIFGGCTVIMGSILALMAYLRSRNKDMHTDISELQIDDVLTGKPNDFSDLKNVPTSRTYPDDPLLTVSSGKTTVHLKNGLQSNVDDILKLAGSTHSITI